MKTVLIVILSFFTTVIHAQQTVAPTEMADAPHYRFGVVPQQSAFKLAQMWTPLLQHLSSTTGLSIEFVTAKDIPSFEEELAQGNYDLAYMNPYHYIVFHDKGYQPLVRDVEKPLRGIIVTRADSDIHDISQLQGLTLAFPAPAAFAASIIPRAELNRAGVSIQPRYVNSHDSVYLNVIKGLFPAGGGIIRSLQHLPDVQRAQLKILWQSDDFTGHAIAVHSRVPAEHQRRLLNAFEQLSDTQQGLQLLALLNVRSLKAARDSDWDNVRELGIHSLSRPDY